MRWNRVSSAVVSYGRLTGRNPRTHKLSVKITSIAAVAALCLTASGCGQQALNKHVTVVSAAVAPVVDQTVAAYRTANAIHDLRVDYDSIDAFNKGDSAYYARNVKPLLSESQIEVRQEVLKGLQQYVKQLVAITNGIDSPALDDASKSLGNNLAELGNQQGPLIETGLGLATATATTETTVTTVSGGTTTAATTSTTSPVPPISADAAGGIVKGVQLLGEFLAYRIEKKDLPAQVEKMDGQMKELCEKLSDEAKFLASREEIDLDSMISRQRSFLLNTQSIDPAIRRNEIQKLPQWQRQEMAGHEQLVKLSAALQDLYMKHHALAAELQGNNPESLKAKLGDLTAAGSNLSKAGSSLSK